MSVHEYDIGDLARLEFSFTNLAGAAADPSSVTASVRSPSGTVTDYEVTAGQIVRDGTGEYHLDVEVTEEGDWTYSGVGTGAIQATVEGSFYAKPSIADTDGAGRVLCGLSDVLRFVPGYDPDTDPDAEPLTNVLRALIRSESRAAHRATNREIIAISPAVSARRFDLARWHERNRRVLIGDATTISSVKVIDRDQTTEVETVASADRVSLPRVREEWEPIRELHFPTGAATPATIRAGLVLEVTATWGWPAVPDDLRLAVARMVIVRYVTDVPADISTAFDRNLEGVSVPGMFASAREVFAGYARRPAVA